MPRKRSRSATEHRFQDAVLELIAAAGFKHLGVNSVAERAGSDKVLIYRYFEDFDGLLQRVAESRRWLPTAEELLKGPGHLPEEQLRSFFRRVSGHVTNDVATHQIALWRNAAKNPLTSKYNEEWKELWKQLAEGASRTLSYGERKNWARAIGMLALVTQSKISGEAVDETWIAFLGQGLEPTDMEEGTAYEKEDILPTNLL